MVERLVRYFTRDIAVVSERSIGMEVETSFKDASGRPISRKQSQAIFRALSRRGWRVTGERGGYISSLTNAAGDNLAYELGRQNIEVSAAPTTAAVVIDAMRSTLNELYAVAEVEGAFPHFEPIIVADEDILAIPDERDATWLRLDGRVPLTHLATTSSVQFTVEVPASDAITILNRLGAHIGSFLADYPQESHWRRYIAESLANYDACRYGGPLWFANLEQYCRQLARQPVVTGERLVPYEQVTTLDVPLFLRSIWWYFRLRRYGSRLCIEVRPLPRRSDTYLEHQLNMVLEIMALPY